MEMNEKMKSDFVTGDFGKVFPEKMIEELTAYANHANANELNLSFCFMDELADNELGIIVELRIGPGGE